MRICHAIFSSPASPLVGGGQKSVDAVATTMAEAGHEVHVIYSRRHGDARLGPVPYQVHWVRHTTLDGIATDFYAQARMLDALLSALRFDLVFGHAENALLFPATCRRHSVPFHLVFHAIRLPGPIGLWALCRPRTLRQDADHHLLRQTAARARRIFTHSGYARRTLRQSLGDACPPVEVVPLGVWPSWSELPVRPSSTDTLRIVSWGRLVPVKGFVHLLNALRQLRVGTRVRLDVAGAGPQEGHLRRLAEALPPGIEARFHGLLSTGQLQGLCAHADVAVFPTLMESFGLSVAEGLASGVPVIATRAGSVPELLGHGRFGTLVEPADPMGLADAIMRVVADRTATRCRADLARAHIQRNCTWPLYSARLLAAV